MRLVFGDYELDTERYELRRATAVVALEPKAFRVLTYLVQHHGRAVAKGDLLAAFWPGAAVDSYTEYALRNCLLKIRQALADVQRPASVIETVRGYGYRFVAPVTMLAPAPAAAGVTLQDSPTPGSALTPAAGHPPLPEQRPLTVLRCGIVSSARLQHLDPEAFQQLVRAFYQVCEETIAPFGGYIAQYDSEELLIYFGYPVAYEDAALRAVRAGWALSETVPRLGLPGDHAVALDLAVRLSIHTGPVVVSESSEAPARPSTLIGAMLSMGKRLQGEAPPNMVLLSATTYALVQGYIVCEALPPPHAAPGEDALARYRVLRESPAQSRFEVARARGLTPLVGRDAEMALLRERWAQVQEGRGQGVLLCGEPGIGKSRVAQELREHGSGTATTQLVWRCALAHQHSAFYPLIAALERDLALTADETAEAKLRKLEALLTPCALPLPALVPLFAALLALPLPAYYSPRALTPQQQRQHMLNAVVTWVLAEAQRQPVVLLIEDLHWSDPSTLELLGLLLDQVPTICLLLLLTARPEFQSPWPIRAYFTPLTLARLPRPQVADLVGRVAGTTPLPPEVVEAVVAKTDGVPLFVEELTKTVLDTRLRQEHAPHDALTGAVLPLAIPATLQDALLARLDQLGTGKVVAQLGAAIGRQFPYAVLRPIACLDVEVLDHELARLVAAELLYQRGIPPQATYTFKHALIQDAAYQSLLRSTRQQVHQRIAQALAQQFPETVETQPEVVAQHYTAAGLFAQALPLWLRAGQRALERSAYREAVASLEQGLEVLRQLPDSRDTREQAIDVRLALRSALFPSRDFERILTCLHEAEAFAEALADTRRLGQIARFLSASFYYMGVYDQAATAAQRALALATTDGDSALQAVASYFLGTPYQAQGDYRRAIHYYRQTATFFAGARRHERFGQVLLPAVQARARLAWCHAELGAFAEGRALGEEGLQIAEESAQPASRMFAVWGMGRLCLCYGDLSRALPLLERAVDLCQNAALATLFPEAAAALGAAYTLSGRSADAVALLTQALEQARTADMVGYQILCGLSLGEAQLLAGSLEEAHGLGEDGLALARRHQERGNEAYALRLLGAIAAQHEPPETAPAEVHSRQALALAGELGMRPLQAHCHRSLGMLYAMAGQHTQARTALATAIELYRAMEMTFWLPQAEAALAQVEG